jgi:hypothetical protein
VREVRFFWEYMTEQTDRIRRVVDLLRRNRVRYALVGGHAVSFHTRPRVTVGVDFLVSSRSLRRIRRELGNAGFVVKERGEVLRLWDPGADTEKDEPVVEIIPAEYNETQREALRTALDVDYQDITIRIVSRPALVALKYLSAVSPARARVDRGQDVVDMGRLVARGWTDADSREARRLVELSHPAAGDDFSRLVEDLRAGRPITI